MPPLNVQLGAQGLVPANCRQVDMDEWAYSAAHPLATVGAGPCLNVVVHAGTAGCLAHIWNSSLEQTELYHKALHSILAMINALHDPPAVEVWLGAGWAFHVGSAFTPSEHAELDFPEYLQRAIEEEGLATVQIRDDRTPKAITHWDPGSVAYDPTQGRVYILESRDDDRDVVYRVQTHIKAAVRGICR